MIDVLEGQAPEVTSVQALIPFFVYVPRSLYGSLQEFGKLVELYISPDPPKLQKKLQLDVLEGQAEPTPIK